MGLHTALSGTSDDFCPFVANHDWIVEAEAEINLASHYEFPGHPCWLNESERIIPSIHVHWRPGIGGSGRRRPRDLSSDRMRGRLHRTGAVCSRATTPLIMGISLGSWCARERAESASSITWKRRVEWEAKRNESSSQLKGWNWTN